jgi:hypothetical protein
LSLTINLQSAVSRELLLHNRAVVAGTGPCPG